MRTYLFNLLLPCALTVCCANAAIAQTTAFTYQGKLTDAGSNPATASYDMQFKLFDTPEVGTGTQQGTAVTNPTVQAAHGIFSVSLDFGVAVFDGSPRYLEIRIRPAGNSDPYTTLAPRQPVTSTPYAIKSLSAADALQLGGVAASQYVVTTDPRLTDERLPLADSPNYVQNTNTTQADANFNISGNGVIGGDLTVLGTLNANFVGNFINNGTAPQPNANFNIDGNGVVGATLLANLFDSATQYNIGGNAVLSLGTGTDNIFIGPFAGQANTTGSANSFLGISAGFNTSTGSSNSFFGRSAGFQNTTGTDNSFFGVQAGRDSSTGVNNSFFGRAAGIGNTTGLDNSYFGAYTGQAVSAGSANSFFGVSAGFNNTGSANSFFGRSAGFQNTAGNDNSFFGVQAGRDNSTGNNNSFFGRAAGIANSTGSSNSFFGKDAGLNNTSGSDNSFFGIEAGKSNLSGGSNVFIGHQAGVSNTTGNSNIHIGFLAGATENNASSGNVYLGYQAGWNNGSNNVAIGSQAGMNSPMGSYEETTSVGVLTRSDGFGATAVGSKSKAAGVKAIAIGYETLAFNDGIAIGNRAFMGGYGSIVIGRNAQTTLGAGESIVLGNDSGTNAVNSVVIGNGTSTTFPNTIVLGSNVHTVRIPGSLSITGNLSKGGGSFKIDHPLDPANKTLSHSFVESPDMMNIYNGVVMLNGRGEAIITLPDYFEALNRDFRYQLTCIGGFAPVFIAQEMNGNHFKIAGGRAGMRISWQVTGIRQDAYANSHRIPTEEDKSASERGTYLHPDAYAQPKTAQSTGKPQARRTKRKTAR